MLTGRERLLAAARGQPVDRLPWAPRIDMWYNAHRRQGTLPDKYRGWSLSDIVQDVGGDLYFNGAQLYRETWTDVQVVEEILEGAPQRRSDAGELIPSAPHGAYGMEYFEGGYAWNQANPRDRRVHYHTPIGTVSQRYLFTVDMERGGVTTPYQVEHWIKGPSDYAVVEYIVAHAELSPAYETFLSAESDLGNRGVAFGWLGYSPFHKIMREFLGYEQAIYELQDHPELVDHLYRVILEKYEEVIDIAAKSPAEIVAICGNWNTLISQPIFRRYFTPYLQACARRLHREGKLVSVHVDGEMRSLLELHVESGGDIAEALTPWPMAQFTLADARAAYGDRVAIWGGLPAIVFSGSFPDEDFKAYLEMVGKTLAPGRRVVLSMGDNLPVDAKFDRLNRINEWAAQYPVA